MPGLSSPRPGCDGKGDSRVSAQRQRCGISPPQAGKGPSAGPPSMGKCDVCTGLVLHPRASSRPIPYLPVRPPPRPAPSVPAVGSRSPFLSKLALRREGPPRTAQHLQSSLFFLQGPALGGSRDLVPLEGLWQGHLPSPSWRGRCWRVHRFLSGQWEECTVHSFVRSFVCSFILQRCPLGPQCDLGPFLGMECSRMNHFGLPAPDELRCS